MPHDKNGAPLKVGDKVTVECVIDSICEGEYCTTSLKTVEVMPGNGQPTVISAINAKQVVKCCLLLLCLLILAGSTARAQDDSDSAPPAKKFFLKADGTVEARVTKVEDDVALLKKQVKALRDAEFIRNNPGSRVAAAPGCELCECGCVETGMCKCKNCNEHTADPNWKKRSATSVKPGTNHQAPDGTWWTAQTDGTWKWCEECNGRPQPGTFGSGGGWVDQNGVYHPQGTFLQPRGFGAFSADPYGFSSTPYSTSMFGNSGGLSSGGCATGNCGDSSGQVQTRRGLFGRFR